MWYKSREEILSALGQGALEEAQLSAAAVVQPPFWNVPFHPSPVLHLNLQKSRAVDKLSPLTGIQMV